MAPAEAKSGQFDIKEGSDGHRLDLVFYPDNSDDLIPWYVASILSDRTLLLSRTCER